MRYLPHAMSMFLGVVAVMGVQWTGAAHAITQEDDSPQGLENNERISGLEVPVIALDLTKMTLTNEGSRAIPTDLFPEDVNIADQQVLGVTSDGTVLFSEYMDNWSLYPDGGACKVRAARIEKSYFREWSIPSDRIGVYLRDALSVLRRIRVSSANEWISDSGIKNRWSRQVLNTGIASLLRMVYQATRKVGDGELPTSLERNSAVILGEQILIHQSGVLDDRFWELGLGKVAERVPRIQSLPGTCSLLESRASKKATEMLGYDGYGIWKVRNSKPELWNLAQAKQAIIANLNECGIASDAENFDILLVSARSNLRNGNIGILAVARIQDPEAQKPYGFDGFVKPIALVVLEVSCTESEYEIVKVRSVAYDRDSNSVFHSTISYGEILFIGGEPCVWLVGAVIAWDDECAASIINANFYAFGRYVSRAVGQIGLDDYLFVDDEGSLESLTIVRFTR